MLSGEPEATVFRLAAQVDVADRFRKIGLQVDCPDPAVFALRGLKFFEERGDTVFGIRPWHGGGQFADHLVIHEVLLVCGWVGKQNVAEEQPFGFEIGNKGQFIAPCGR